MGGLARAVLFGDGDGHEDQVTGINEMLEQAEAEYDAAEAAGEGVELDLATQDAAEALGHDDDGDGGGAVQDDGAPSSGDPADDGGAVSDDDGSDDGSDEEPPPADLEPPAPQQNFRFANHEAAEAAYREAQAEMQRALSRLDLLENQQYAMQQNFAPAVEPQMPSPAALNENPIEAFQAALEHGNDQIAQSAVDRVRQDAMSVQNQAVLAQAEGDESAYQLHAMQAAQLAQVADAMQRDLVQAASQRLIEERLRPIEEASQRDRINRAAHRVFAQDHYKGDHVTVEHQQAVGQYLQQNPDLVEDWGDEAAIARAMDAVAQHVVFGGVSGMVDFLVRQRLGQQQQAAAPGQVPVQQHVRRAPSRATGGGAGRKSAARAPSSPDDVESQSTRDSVANIPNNGMNVLFNRG